MKKVYIHFVGTAANARALVGEVEVPPTLVWVVGETMAEELRQSRGIHVMNFVMTGLGQATLFIVAAGRDAIMVVPDLQAVLDLELFEYAPGVRSEGGVCEHLIVESIFGRLYVVHQGHLYTGAPPTTLAPPSLRALPS